MISKFLSLSAALILCANTFTAQVSNYTFSQSIGSYGTPSTGTFIGLSVQDDDVNLVNLPFNFVFNGTAYATVSVCTNGYISFGPITGTEYSPVSDANTQQLISAFGTNLYMGVSTQGMVTAGSNIITNCSSVASYSVGDVLRDWANNNFGGVDPVITGISGSSIILNIPAVLSDQSYPVFVYGSIRMAVSGIAPNRICEFEYQHLSRLILDESVGFKIKLYETSNKIEIVYGDMVPAPGQGNPTAEVGLKGLTIADYNSRNVTNVNTWSTSIAAAAINDACDFSSTSMPVKGQIYAWTPCMAPTLSVVQSPSTSCAGASVTLSASGAGSYSWTNGPTTSQYTLMPLATAVYTLTGTSAGCPGILMVTHSVIPNPTLSILQSSNQQCAGATISLTASGAGTYSWTNGPVTPQFTINPGITSTYTVTGLNGGLCSNTGFITQSVIPYPVLSVAGASATICNGQTAVLTATGATTYSWSNGQTTAQISVTPIVTTSYTLMGSNAQCTSTASVTQNVSRCVGLNELAITEPFSVYPNPFVNDLTIKNDGDEQLLVNLVDILGKVVYRTVISGNSTETIQTDFLNNGIYVLSISHKGLSVTKKIVKD